MAIGGVKRGGGSRGPKAAGGKAGSDFSGRVTGNDAAGKAEGLSGASRAAGSGEVGAATSADPVSVGAQAIAKALKDGKIASKQEATQQLVALILKRGAPGAKGSKSQQKLVERIADTLVEDPRLAAALERTWKRAGQGSK